MSLDNEIETLCFRLLTDQVSRASFIERCLALACITLECSTSALWMFVDAPEGRAIRRVACYDRARSCAANADGQDRLGADLFFHALIEVGQVVANDVLEHPAARVFIQDTAAQLAVRSLIATPCFLNGRLVGAFVCTHVGETAPWSIRQLFLLRRLSVRATSAMATMAPPEIDGPSP
jgi:GAF domain-containing protein